MGTNFIRAVPKIERSVNGALVYMYMHKLVARQLNSVAQLLRRSTGIAGLQV